MFRRVAIWSVVLMAVGVAAASCNKSTDTASSGAAPSTTTAASSTTGSTGGPATTAEPGGTPSTTQEGASVSGPKETFLEQGNAICKTMNQKSQGYSKQYEQGSKSAAETQKLLDQNGDLIEDSITKLKALPQPPGDQSKLEAMYADVLELASFSHQLATAAGQSDAAKMQQLQTEGKTQQTKVNREFTDYGLTECGKGS